MKLLKLLMWGPAHFIAVRLPYRAALRFGRLIGGVAYLVLRGLKMQLRAALAGIITDANPAEIETMVSGSFMQQSTTELENTLHNTFNPDNIKERIPVEGLDRLDASLKKGKGVLLATFHFGAHLQVMPALGHRGYKVNQVAFAWDLKALGEAGGKPKDRVAAWLHRARRKHSADSLPVNVIPLTKDSSIRPVIRRLQEKQIVVIAVDGRQVGNLAEFRFLACERYYFSPGAGELASRLGVPLHPIFIVRGGDLIARLIIEESIPEEIVASKSAERYTAFLVGRLEHYVRRYPDHYGMELVYEQRRLNMARNQGAYEGTPKP